MNRRDNIQTSYNNSNAGESMFAHAQPIRQVYPIIFQGELGTVAWDWFCVGGTFGFAVEPDNGLDDPAGCDGCHDEKGEDGKRGGNGYEVEM